MELADIYAACRRIRPYIHRTPLLTSRLLDNLLGKRLLLKAEHLQKTGSFKARGALAKALTLERPKGLLAVSSGNHAQGVAYAAQVLGVKALIVMPEDASPFKKQAARAYGAEAVDRGVRVENREEAILEAERLLFTRTKQVVEPTGALPLAAVLEHGDRLPGTLALLLSGGNRGFCPSPGDF